MDRSEEIILTLVIAGLLIVCFGPMGLLCLIPLIAAYLFVESSRFGTQNDRSEPGPGSRPFSGGGFSRFRESVFNHSSSSRYSWTEQEHLHRTFLVCVFSMFGKLCKADGVVCGDEIGVVDSFISRELGLTAEQRQQVIQIFQAGKSSSRSFHDYSEEFYAAFCGEPVLLVNVIDILLQLSSSDGTMSEQEERLVSGAAMLFGLSEGRYESLRSLYLLGVSSDQDARGNVYREARARQQGRGKRREKKNAAPFWSDNDRSYAVLNCTRDCSDRKIKKSYRKLVHEHHPDRVIAKGLPKEFEKLANKKFREIQEAYEAVCEERGMR